MLFIAPDQMLESPIEFEELDPGRQFVFAERRQSGVWVRFLRVFRNDLAPAGRQLWWAGSIPDGAKLSAQQGVVQNGQRWILPVQREYELVAPWCWPDYR